MADLTIYDLVPTAYRFDVWVKSMIDNGSTWGQRVQSVMWPSESSLAKTFHENTMRGSQDPNQPPPAIACAEIYASAFKRAQFNMAAVGREFQSYQRTQKIAPVSARGLEARGEVLQKNGAVRFAEMFTADAVP